jgi:hypothetical protein
MKEVSSCISDRDEDGEGRNFNTDSMVKKKYSPI